MRALPVGLDASQSSDNVAIFSYEWNFGDGEKVSGVKAIHTYSSLGDFTVRFFVKDSANNTATDWITITITPQETVG